MFLGGTPQQHPFWSEKCPDRPGGDLTHVQNGSWMDPCAECGKSPNDPDPVTQRRLAELGSLPAHPRNEFAAHTYQPTITGMCLRCRRSNLEGNHPGYVGTPPIMEPKMAKGEYQQWQKAVRGGYDYAPGDPNGPGRGELSPAWKNWAGLHKWKLGGT